MALTKITGQGIDNVTVDSSGNVGIGTTSPSGSKLHISGNANNSSALSDTVTDFALKFDSATTTNYFSNAICFAEGTNVNASIASFDGGSGGAQGLVFGTGASNTERMRIDSSGNLLVGYTSSNGAYKLQVNSQIFATSATIATSDGNYKENVTPLNGVLSLVSQLNPVQFDWKEHPVHEFDRNQPTIGFIAQEVQQVLAEQPYLNSIVKSNECVLEPEETDDEGNVIKEAVTESFLGIAEGNMVALLTAAIKEQQATITALEARIAALENA